MSSGGRYHNNGRHGGSSHNGRNNNHTGRGRGGRGSFGARTGESQRDESDTKEPFSLSGKPTTLEIYKWLNNMENWARMAIPKVDWFLVVRKEGGDAPIEKDKPVEPKLEDYPESAVFSAKHAMYRTEEQRVHKLNEDIREGKKMLYGQMIKHSSEAFLVNVKAKMGPEFFVDEDPKKLADAIISEFIGLNTSAAHNRMAVATQEKLFHNIFQTRDMSLADYREHYNIQFRTLCQGKHHLQKDRADARSLDDITATLYDQEELANIFVLGLNKSIYGEFFEDVGKKHEKWPKTLANAYERMNELEQPFLTRYHDNRRNDRGRDDRERVPVMSAHAKGYSKPKAEYDSHRKQICSYEKRNGAGSCKYGAKCTFSHEIDHSAKSKGGTIATGGPSYKAAATKKSAEDSQCGGGPGPGKG